MSQDKLQINFTQLNKRRDAVITIDSAKNILFIAFADRESEVVAIISAQCIDFGFKPEELSSGLMIHIGYGYLPSEVAQLVALALEQVGLKVDRDFPLRSTDGRLNRQPHLR